MCIGMSPGRIDCCSVTCVNDNVEMGSKRTGTLNNRKVETMKTTMSLIRSLALASAVAWSISEARAALTTAYTFSNGGTENFLLTWDTHTGFAAAGALRMTDQTHPGHPSFLTVCTDVGATVIPSDTYLYDSPTVFNGHDGIRPTWGSGNQNSPPNAVNMANASAAIQAAADIFFTHQGVLTSGTLTDKAALQLAVWEALYDTTSGGSPSLNLTTGRFKVLAGDAAAIAEAASWALAVNYSHTYAGYLLVPDPTVQNGALAQETFFNVTPVPEPTTMIAGAMLLLPFGASTLRFMRNKRVT